MKAIRPFAAVGSAGLIVLLLTFCLIPVSACSAAGSSSVTPPRVGGLCDYKKYPGEAEIVSIHRRPEAPQEYEIKFAFHSQEVIAEEFARTGGKTWTLVRKDFSYPDKDFLNRHDIKPGKRLPCYLKAITRGTCTPVLFEFPTIPGGGSQ